MKTKNATHTPGPWQVNGGQVWGTSDQGARLICDVSGTGLSRFEPNARLIAAAPELLAALKDVRDNAADDSPDMWARVDAAITKAEEIEWAP